MKQANEMTKLCDAVRKYISRGAYEDGRQLVCKAMAQFPHAPQPHNLLGLLLEKTGDHATAMRHFRAAWALDPSYLPANHNLHFYGTFRRVGKCAIDESDLVSAGSGSMIF